MKNRSTIGGTGHYLLYSRRVRHEWACNNSTDGYPGMPTGQTLSNTAESTVWGKYLSSLKSCSTPHCYPSRYTIYNPQNATRYRIPFQFPSESRCISLHSLSIVSVLFAILTVSTRNRCHKILVLKHLTSLARHHRLPKSSPSAKPTHDPIYLPCR